MMWLRMTPRPGKAKSYARQAAWAAWCLSVSTFAHAEGTVLPPSTVQDLPYGSALYYFFQEKYFSSATEILVNLEQGQVPHHADEAELLLGGMYLSYGLFNEAERIFEKLINQQTRPDTANRAWFHLAQIFYQRDHIDQAQRAIERIRGTLPGDLGIRKILLHASLLMRTNQYNAAIALLENLRDDSVWAMYGQFNLGIALLRVNRNEEGLRHLQIVSKHKGHDTELAALKDKANLALGYAAIKNNQPEEARTAFRRLRLDGPSSNAGLYGLGQSHFARKHYHEALNFWLELGKRSTRGPAVFEALLAVPQAYALMELYPIALQHYERALDLYQNELDTLDNSIAAIQTGNLFDKMILRDVVSEQYWPWDPKNLPDEYRQHYITQLFASYEFNEALRNYRDLLFFRGLLSGRRADIDHFELMLKTRKHAFDERLPQALKIHADHNPTALKQEIAFLTEKTNSAASSHDLIAFANVKELDAWRRLETIGHQLDALAAHSTDDLSLLRGKHELLRGRVLWDINDDFKPRLYAARKALHITAQEFAQAEQRHASVLQARDQEPVRFIKFGERIDTGRQRLEELLRETNGTIAAQQVIVRKLAIARLNQQSQRIRNYLAQAQYGAAQINELLLERSRSDKANPAVPNNRP